VPLLADADAAALRVLEQTGTWPVNHLVVVRDDLLAAEPGLAGAIVDAFERAKRIYLESGELQPLHARVAEVTGGDPLPYGVEANRAVLEELIDHAVAQRILSHRPDVGSLFA
jgi:4,5-dihydroxyphthalate decarboxylase